MTRKIGFVGIGKMGTAISRNLLKAGFEVKGYDVVEERLTALEPDGLVAAKSPAETAADAAVVFTMLTRPEAISEVIFGANGIVKGAKPGTIVVDMSTMAPAFERKIADQLKTRGMRPMDAPVSGSVPHAEAAALLVMAAGEAATFDEVKPVFQGFAKTILHVGASGAGAVMKLVTATVQFGAFTGLLEGLILGEKAGLKIGEMLDVLKLGVANSRVLEFKDPLLRHHDFDEQIQGTNEIATKDLALVVEAAREMSVPVPHAALALQDLISSNACGNEKRDYAALLRVLETRAGL